RGATCSCSVAKSESAMASGLPSSVSGPRTTASTAADAPLRACGNWIAPCRAATLPTAWWLADGGHTPTVPAPAPPVLDLTGLQRPVQGVQHRDHVSGRLQGDQWFAALDDTADHVVEGSGDRTGPAPVDVAADRRPRELEGLLGGQPDLVVDAWQLQHAT